MFCWWFLSIGHEPRNILKKRFLVEKIPPKDWPVSKSMGHFPDLMTDMGGPSRVGGATPEQVMGVNQ